MGEDRSNAPHSSAWPFHVFRRALRTRASYQGSTLSHMNLGGKSGWKEVGSVGLTADSARIDGAKICWMETGCGGDTPSDLGGWGWGIFILIGIGVVAFATIILLLNRYCRQRQAKREAIQREAEAQRKLDQALKEMDTLKLDDELGSVAEKLEKAKQEQRKLMQARANLQQLPKEWDLSVDPDEHLVPIQPSECVSCCPLPTSCMA